ncbi:hypothetical protein [Mycobacterium sp.]|uniref:hypothetical protein n=1 Tax=Mycobacterium sp. TaxID=1785 RepID=UPI0026392008|nr:hypothetical protein [Mycobacterium sp.]
MTMKDDLDTNPSTNPPTAHQPSERRRHPTGVVVGVGLAGALVGAVGTVVAIAFAWIISVGPPGPPLPPGPPMLFHGPPPPPMAGPGGFGLAPPGPPGPPRGSWPAPPNEGFPTPPAPPPSATQRP